MFTRDDIIKNIPKPTNREVILYDVSLRHLEDVDVLNEYHKLYPEFKSKKEEYLILRKEIEEYKNNIDNTYLYKPSWSEEDYLRALRDERKTYSTLYHDAKKAEDTINILQNKIKNFNEQIKIQIAKDEKLIKKRQETLNDDINKVKGELFETKIHFKSCKNELQKIKRHISENEDEFQILKQIIENFEHENYKCPYCGSTFKKITENSRIYKKMQKNIFENKNELEDFLRQEESLEVNIKFYEDKIKTLENDLNNLVNFRDEKITVYQKKSLDVLKLEGLRNQAIKDVAEKEKFLKNNPTLKTNNFLKLKEKINEYETSLNNLRQIKQINEQISFKKDRYQDLQIELKEDLTKIEDYIKYISIHYKIIEQKANEFFGENIKFNFFKIVDYEIKPDLKITYNEMNYFDLPEEQREKLDKKIIEKFSIIL